jgi:hypothetical protein
MERYKFYKDLSIPRIQFADSLSEADFTRWTTKGEQNPILLSRTTFDSWLKAGGHARALNQIVENAHARANTGQRYAQFDGFNMVVPGLKTMKVMAPNETVSDLWKSTFAQFNARYPQYVDCPQNTELVNQFIRANRDALPEGETVAPSLAAWESFYKICFSRLYLRRVTKVVTEAGAGASQIGTAQSLKVTAVPGQAFNPLLYADIQRKQQQNAKAKAAKESRERSPYARPAVEATLVEEILTPQQVMHLSADETAVMMSPMSFPSVTDSADEYSRSASFTANEPAPKTASEALGQTHAMVEREVALFTKNYPQYSKYCGDPEHYAGLYEKIMAKLEDWKMAVSVSSLLDGFRWAEHEGLIGVTEESRDVQRGQAVAVKINPDDNPHWTKTDVGSIRFHGKKVREMSAAELQDAMNSSPDLRKLLDQTA